MGLMVAIYIADAEWTPSERAVVVVHRPARRHTRAAYDALRQMPKVAQ
jgi:hypothetical protein